MDEVDGMDGEERGTMEGRSAGGRAGAWVCLPRRSWACLGADDVVDVVRWLVATEVIIEVDVGFDFPPTTFTILGGAMLFAWVVWVGRDLPVVRVEVEVEVEVAATSSLGRTTGEGEDASSSSPFPVVDLLPPTSPHVSVSQPPAATSQSVSDTADNNAPFSTGVAFSSIQPAGTSRSLTTSSRRRTASGVDTSATEPQPSPQSSPSSS